ncbi:MAG: HAD-IA family hydrolase [Bacteroidetes bacterium]|nr:HAD-IA family hydrolase [Bacteroidota bacterium]
MKNKKIKILFSDIGGVLLNNGWGHESRKKAAQLFSLDYSSMEILHNFIFNVYEIGRISLDEYLDTTVFNQPRSFTRDDFKKFMLNESIKLPEMFDWLISWRRQHPEVAIIAINNEGKELNDFRIQQFALHDCFDAFISSCEVGMRKPDPGIFQLALGVAQAEPQNCFYIDDRPMLAEAASKLGIHAITHQHFEETTNKINAFFK